VGGVVAWWKDWQLFVNEVIYVRAASFMADFMAEDKIERHRV
jgi:hypothetical protein